MTEMTFGTRKLQFQKVSGAYNLNVPKYAVKTLGLRAGDDMRILLTDEGSLRIEKEHDRVVGAELPGTTPTTGAQHTSRGVVADD